MTEFLCNYAILRFLPYKDIGEFINVGVVVHCPETGLFDFKLAEARNRRVRLFFPELDKVIYRAALDAVQRELARHRNVEGLFTHRAASEQEIGVGIDMFRRLLQRKEALLHFAAPGTVLANPQVAAAELYDRYVDRRFAQDAGYQESVMRGQLGKWLRQWGVSKKYRRDVTVGDEMFHLTLPFVHVRNGERVKAIRPLDLDRPEPTRVFEHGDAWVGRVRRLAERNALPKQLVFAVRLPQGADAAHAASTVLADLTMPQVQWVPFDQGEQLRGAVQV